jgi:hypothetical protein
MIRKPAPAGRPMPGSVDLNWASKCGLVKGEKKRKEGLVVGCVVSCAVAARLALATSLRSF